MQILVRLPVKDNPVTLISEEISLIVRGIPIDIGSRGVVGPIKECCLVGKNASIAVIDVVQAVKVWDIYSFR